MKTAMQELIDDLDRKLVKSIFERLKKDDVFNKALQKEKEQIIDAYMLGFNDSYKYHIQKLDKVTPRNGEEYYNQTYNQDK
jgi:hypothetical protein